MALVAGLAMRFGFNSVVAAICVGIAIVGTWILLSPQNEVLQPVLGATAGGSSNVAPAGAVDATSSVAAFSGPPENAPRERLRSAPRMAVGFADAETQAPSPAVPRLPETDDDLFAESVAPVRALGQLPQDARVLSIETTVEPASNVGAAYTLGRFEVRAASRCGSDHVILGEARQDDFVVSQAADGRYLVVVVADGVGTAENAHFGSYWASRLLAQTIDRHLREGVPGIEKMLARTRDDLSELFDMRFTDGTKLRSIATTLVGLIAPIDGGPAAGFRVGTSDILVDGADGWTSLFGAPSVEQAEAVFPRSIDADVAPIDFDVNCLLLAADGVSGPIAGNGTVAESFSERLAAPIPEVEFDKLLSFPLEEARGDRTAVAVWFDPR